LSLKCTIRPSPEKISGSWKVKAGALRASEKALVTGWETVFEVNARFSARIQEGLEGWTKGFLNSKGYARRPSIAKLRKDFSSQAAWLAKDQQIRTFAEAALQSAAFNYMAKDAPDEMLFGYAAISRSDAVLRIPAALSDS